MARTPVPSTHQARCSQHPALASGVSPMMPLDRMPSISLGIILPTGAAYDSHHHWHSTDGMLNASVRFDAGGYSNVHIQGSPVALRELAAALTLAAGTAGSTRAARNATPERSFMVQGWATNPCTLTG